MNKKQAYELLAEKFDHNDFLMDDYVGHLCTNLPKKMRKDFQIYWRKINSEKHITIVGYIPDDECDEWLVVEVNLFLTV